MHTLPETVSVFTRGLPCFNLISKASVQNSTLSGDLESIAVTKQRAQLGMLIPEA